MAVLGEDLYKKEEEEIRLKEEKRIKFEDAYKKAWISQNKKDVLEKPELKIRSHFKSEKEVKKKVVLEPPLPKQAKIVNSMLSEGKSPKQVAKTLFENVKYITQMISKYNLPRN